MDKVYIKYNCRDHMSSIPVDTKVISKIYITEEVLLLDDFHLIENTLKDYGFVDEDTINTLYKDKRMCNYVYNTLMEDTTAPLYEIYIVYCNNIDSMNGISKYIYACRRDNTWEKYPFPYCIILFENYNLIKNPLLIEILSGLIDDEISEDCKGYLYKVYDKDFHEAKDIIETLIDYNTLDDD